MFGIIFFFPLFVVGIIIYGVIHGNETNDHSWVRELYCYTVFGISALVLSISVFVFLQQCVTKFAFPEVYEYSYSGSEDYRNSIFYDSVLSSSLVIVIVSIILSLHIKYFYSK